MSTTTIESTLTTKAAETGGMIVFKFGKTSLVGLSGSNPERRIVRITRALKKADVDVSDAKSVVLKSAPKGAHNVRGMTGAEIAELVG